MKTATRLLLLLSLGFLPLACETPDEKLDYDDPSQTFECTNLAHEILLECGRGFTCGIHASSGKCLCNTDWMACAWGVGDGLDPDLVETAAWEASDATFGWPSCADPWWSEEWEPACL